MSDDGLSIAFSYRDLADAPHDSDLIAQRLFQWMIAPLSADCFDSQYLERRPFAVLRAQAAQTGKVRFVTTATTLPGMLKARLTAPSSSLSQQPSVPQVEEEVEVETQDAAAVSSSSPSSSSSPPRHYYSGWFSKAEVFSLLESGALRFTADVDVTQYRDGKRLTLNPADSPVATAASVRSFFSSGCSVRFLSPQQHSDRVWRLLHLLDSALGMQCGANSYLTPAGTQGFSPHYDDVDIFILQTEGSKRWRLYEPREEKEILALHSSRNFSQHELGRCVLDVWLQAGDFLYAPRGTVHQCVASEQEDSLHVTVSSCLQASWGDYLQRLLRMAVEKAKAGDAAFRRVLPLGWQRYMGAQHAADGDEEKRDAFLDQTMRLLERMVTKDGDDELPFDAAADDMARDFMHSRIRPVLLPQQQARTRIAAAVQPDRVGPRTRVRLTQADVLRLTWEAEDGGPRLHHLCDNSRVYQGEPLSFIDLHPAHAPAVQALTQAYPQWLRVDELPYVAPEVEDEDGVLGEKEEKTAASDEREGDEEEEDAEAAEVRLAEMQHLCQVLCESGLLETVNDGETDGQQDEEVKQ